VESLWEPRPQGYVESLWKTLDLGLTCALHPPRAPTVLVSGTIEFVYPTGVESPARQGTPLKGRSVRVTRGLSGEILLGTP